MKVKSVVKYCINSMKKSIAIYYSIIISLFLLLVLLSKTTNARITLSGTEFSTVIFLFASGFSMFKENFYFTKSNNISRKTYFLGTILSMIQISAGMSFIDLILNRICNIFIKNPTMYDMGFTDYINDGTIMEITCIPADKIYPSSWIQSNSIGVLFNTFLFHMSLCLMLFALGFVITMIYYRCNKIMKVVVSTSPVILFIILNIYIYNYPNQVIKIGRSMEYILGINPNNVYPPIITFIVLFIAYTGVGYLAVRRMVIKEK